MATNNKKIQYKALESATSRRSSTLWHNERESAWLRSLVFAVLLPSIISTILVVLALISGWTIEGAAQKWINDNRASTQIIVQLISGVLGVCDVLVVRKLVNFASRLALNKRPITLDMLKLLSALSIDRFDFSLRRKHLPILVVSSASAILPAALWAGALTPVDTSIVRDTFKTGSPAYSVATEQYWSADWYNYNGTRVRNDLGVFSYAAPLHRYGYLHRDGGAASSLDGSPQLHVKNDNSNFTYVGRSYGVGSLVGLQHQRDFTLTRGMLGYNYNESGYLSKVDCIHNASSAFDLDLVQSSPNGAIPDIYDANGAGPAKAKRDLTKRSFTMVGFGGEDSIVAIAWYPPVALQDSQDRIWYYAFATGDNYAPLNKAQCAVTVKPANFNVVVDLQLRTITVQPLAGDDTIENIESTWLVFRRATETAGGLSMIDTTYYTSVLGDMFLNNTYNVQSQPTSESNTTKAYRGIAEALEILIDDTLVATGSAQLVIANDTASHRVTARLQALQIGQPVYVYATVALNLCLFLAAIVEGVRHSFWDLLPKFDFVDAEHVVLAASRGGTGVADEAHRLLRRFGKEELRSDSYDKVAGAVQVCLSESPEGMILSLPCGQSVRKERYSRHKDYGWTWYRQEEA